VLVRTFTRPDLSCARASRRTRRQPTGPESEKASGVAYNTYIGARVAAAPGSASQKLDLLASTWQATRLYARRSNL
jgi:hypothetical protein